ncbi:putative toxin-antitoxin system toxin component, PIN family [Leptolyngbya sp. BL0902]|uniref:putative toxin-antitoxin system toxin component, PIN family n=1 Tax=Leptolyngbya sp. BL0902 TaxID=1115757 RepID=UPI0018E817D3|nr:putative toxin-antitoxin system toxin component, PIN family [Leptolyngbya sp. BL0902]
MKLVIDTNVLIAAFIAKGVCHRLVEHCLRSHQVIASDFILQELHRNLTQKFNLSDEDSQSIRILLQNRVQIVKPIPFTSQICRDADDDNVLGTAIAGNAVCIVTGDKDLLSLNPFQSVDILSPAEFAAYEERLWSG